MRTGGGLDQIAFDAGVNAVIRSKTTGSWSFVIVKFVDDDAGLFSEAERQAITEMAQAVTAEVRALLPGLAPDVVMEVSAGKQVIPETGELGAAAAPGLVTWTVDTTRPEGVLAIAESQLRGTLFHELHHINRGFTMQGGYTPTSFMDHVVSEGLATVFEREATGKTPPWGQYPDDVDEWVAELLELPISASYWEWMFQHPDGRRWIGYRAGTYIAERAVERSGRSAADLVNAPTDEVLELAGIGRGKTSVSAG